MGCQKCSAVEIAQISWNRLAAALGSGDSSNQLEQIGHSKNTQQLHTTADAQALLVSTSCGMLIPAISAKLRAEEQS